MDDDEMSHQNFISSAIFSLKFNRKDNFRDSKSPGVGTCGGAGGGREEDNFSLEKISIRQSAHRRRIFRKGKHLFQLFKVQGQENHAGSYFKNQQFQHSVQPSAASFICRKMF